MVKNPEEVVVVTGSRISFTFQPTELWLRKLTCRENELPEKESNLEDCDLQSR